MSDGDSEDERNGGCEAGDSIMFTGREVEGGQEIIRHLPNHTFEEAVLYPHKDGQPIPPDAELVGVKRSQDGGSAEIRSIYKSPPAHKPAQVATNAYRTGWERTFGSN